MPALGALFSVPNVASADAIVALEGTVLRAAEASLHDVAAGMRFMQLVEGKLRHRKVPHTEAALARQAMWCPVSVQEYEQVARQGDSVDVVTLRLVGMPVVRGLTWGIGEYCVPRCDCGRTFQAPFQPRSAPALQRSSATVIGIFARQAHLLSLYLTSYWMMAGAWARRQQHTAWT